MKPELIPTRLGRLPSDWRVMPLGEVTERDSTPIEVKPNQVYREIGIRSHGKGVFHKDPVKGATLGAKRVFEVTPERLVFNIVFAWEGAVGVTSERERGMIASHRFPMFGPNGLRLIDVEFLRRFFQTDLGVRLLGDASPGGAGRNRTLNQKFTAEIPVPVPPLGEQKKIAAILSSVDNAIEATQAVIDQLAVVKKAMMADLLTRGLPGRHTKFKTTEIGEVPEEWEVVRLGDACERMFVGIAQAATHAYVTAGGVPIIRTTNVRPNLLRTDDILRINESFAAEMKTKRLRAGDVLSARTGYPGTSVVVPALFDGAQCFTLLVSRPGPRLVSGFLCHLMNSDVGAHIVQRGQAGGAQQNLNVGVFQEAVVGLPPVEEQQRICQHVDAVYTREWSEEAILAGLRALKSALMSVLLTGEVRVKLDGEAA